MCITAAVVCDGLCCPFRLLSTHFFIIFLPNVSGICLTCEFGRSKGDGSVRTDSSLTRPRLGYKIRNYFTPIPLPSVPFPFQDDPWGVVRSRALEAGRLLAAVLLSRPVGSRPVTLLGFSMGAKVN